MDGRNFDFGWLGIVSVLIKGFTETISDFESFNKYTNCGYIDIDFFKWMLYVLTNSIIKLDHEK